MQGWEAIISQDIWAWAWLVFAVAFIAAISLIRKKRKSRRRPQPIQKGEIVFIGGEAPDMEQAERLAKQYGLEVHDITPVEWIDISQDEPRITPSYRVRLRSRPQDRQSRCRNRIEQLRTAHSRTERSGLPGQHSRAQLASAPAIDDRHRWRHHRPGAQSTFSMLWRVRHFARSHGAYRGGGRAGDQRRTQAVPGQGADARAYRRQDRTGRALQQ